MIRAGRFGSGEPESHRIRDWVKPGDWVLDIGANIGNYTVAFSQAVGPRGRVLAFEPVPTTFQLLSHHVSLLRDSNVTLMNVAVSDRFATITMDIPRFETGLENLYQARISEKGALSVVSVAIDSLAIDHPVRLVKIDVEGHELSVLSGMRHLIERDRPLLIIEGDLPAYGEMLSPLGYVADRLPGSPNTVFTAPLGSQ